jgi:ATP-dependent Clp protease protease subunit
VVTKAEKDIIKTAVNKQKSNTMRPRAKTPQVMLSALNKMSFGSDKVMNGFALLMNDIDEDAAKEIVTWIIESNFSEERPDVLNLIICSPGGELASAFAIIDVMKSSHIPIRTIGLGQIASAGLMCFMAGSKGMRVLTPNTSIMSHAWSGGSIGKVGELFAVGKEFELTQQRMISHYVRHTGLKEKDVLTYLLPPHDVYLSAEEALELKLCDKIVDLK